MLKQTDAGDRRRRQSPAAES